MTGASLLNKCLPCVHKQIQLIDPFMHYSSQVLYIYLWNAIHQFNFVHLSLSCIANNDGSMEQKYIGQWVNVGSQVVARIYFYKVWIYYVILCIKPYNDHKSVINLFLSKDQFMLHFEAVRKPIIFIEVFNPRFL